MQNTHRNKIFVNLTVSIFSFYGNSCIQSANSNTCSFSSAYLFDLKYFYLLCAEYYFGCSSYERGRRQNTVLSHRNKRVKLLRVIKEQSKFTETQCMIFLGIFSECLILH